MENTIENTEGTPGNSAATVGLRYSSEPSSITMIIGVAVTLLGIGLALGNAGPGEDNLVMVGALISVAGAVALGMAQTGKIVGILSGLNYSA